MKKNKKLNLMILIGMMVLLISTNAYANTTTSQIVNGSKPEGNEYDNDILKLKVNNIVTTLSTKEYGNKIKDEQYYSGIVGEMLDGAFVVENSAEITVNKDGFASFQGYKLIKNKDGYSIDYNNPIQPSKVNVVSKDEETGEICYGIGTNMKLMESGEYYIVYSGVDEDKGVQMYIKVQENKQVKEENRTLNNSTLVEVKNYSVSNVIEQLGEKEIGGQMYETLVVESPTTITLINSSKAIFNAYKLTKTNEDTYNYDQDKSILKEGKVSISVPDELGKKDTSGYPIYVEKIIDASELEKYKVDIPIYLPGCRVTLTEPGNYYITSTTEGAGTDEELFITVTDGKNVEIPKDSQVDMVTAVPSNANVKVNGKIVSLDAYNIDGNNCFKLRDLAKVVNGTEKQFEVTWDGEKKAINLVSHKPYTITGGELSKGDGQNKTGKLNTSIIYKDGKEIKLIAYNINGNNYFNLRDVASAFDIGVTWDGVTNTVGIDTTISYE
ncbi:MAG: copper amine oxidase N-terminal domain-containing protein [Marinisporobacter sp.]|jgi:hypothetical protein|nr:copper amine oxidase N-terminal domain-containing protein [Marinisporobacter sp.]